MFNQRACYRISIIILFALLSACGGGGGNSSSDSSTITSVGRIDGFGSVYVNGIEFDTTDTAYRVDDEIVYDDSVLAVGMKVRIEGHINSDNRTGTAYSIYYDDDLEGPIDSGSLVESDNNKQFTVLGLNVSVDASNTVFHDGATFEGLVEGAEIEVSGFFDGDVLIASRIELQRDSNHDYEIKGTLIQYDGTSLTLRLRNSTEAGPYPVSDSVRIDDLPPDPIGSHVEIKLVNNAGTLEVLRIEGEDDHLIHDYDDYVTMRGILSGNDSNGYTISGIPMEISPATQYEPSSLQAGLVAGMMVKVKGEMSNGNLIAYRIEAKYREAKVEARVSSVEYSDPKNGSVTLDLGNSQSLVVFTDNSTSFENASDDHDYSGSSASYEYCSHDHHYQGSSSDGDENCSDDRHYSDNSSFLLSELTDSDFVEVEIALRDAGFYAHSIERKRSSEGTEVEALVEALSPDSITLLGITFTIDGATSISGTPEIGYQVEVKDYNSDGSADRIEVEGSRHGS